MTCVSFCVSARVTLWFQMEDATEIATRNRGGSTIGKCRTLLGELESTVKPRARHLARVQLERLYADISTSSLTRLILVGAAIGSP
jgi:hypothetical protein